MSAKIGVFAVGLEAYCAQFSGLKKALLGHHQTLLDKLSGDYQIVAAGMVDSPQKAHEAGRLFQSEDVDLVFCHLTTYAASDALLPVARALKGVTFVLLNVQSTPALDLDNVKSVGQWLGQGCTCAGLPEMVAVLRRFEHPVAVLSGYLDGDQSFDAEIKAWSRAAQAKNRLKSGSLGLLGRPYPGMMDLNVDETQLFRTFGSYVKHLNWEEIAANIAHGYDKKAISEAKERVKAVFSLPQDLPEAALTSLAEVLLATQELVEKHQLIGLANHFEIEPDSALLPVIAASNPVFSMLTQQGIACPVEADLKVAIAMILMKSIGGSATLAELYSMDFANDICLIGHSGAGDPDISEHKSLLTMSAVFHGKPGSGFMTQFSPALGPVTLAALTQDAQGNYRLVVAEGELENGKVLQLGDTNARFRFRDGLRTFVTRWSLFGPTHHASLGRGHHAQSFHKLGQLLGVAVDEV